VRPYYDDGTARIFHGDCREVLPDLKADLLVTDPPYASGARRDAERQVRGSMLRGLEDPDWFSHDAMTTWGFSWFLRSVLAPIQQTLSPGAHLYWFTDWRMAPTIYGMLEATGYRVNHCLVWDKTYFGMGAYWRNQHEHIVFGSVGTPAPMLNRGMGSVLHHPPVPDARRRHPTEKPVGLIRKLLTAVPGQLVVDPFMGVGPVLRAAKALGRPAVGVELEERYCEIAAKDLEREAAGLFPLAPVQEVLVP
jgi:site-specific DNA-methyltransferase (adenine-specific)